MAQQYRNTGLPGPTFLKSGGQHPSDHSAASNGRAQLKSPSSNQQDVLSSVFSSGKLIVQISLAVVEECCTDTLTVSFHM
jgi:hypothetical protein